MPAVFEMGVEVTAELGMLIVRPEEPGRAKPVFSGVETLEVSRMGEAKMDCSFEEAEEESDSESESDSEDVEALGDSCSPSCSESDSDSDDDSEDDASEYDLGC